MKILIFGAGVNQITLLKAAKELNFITYAIDPNEDAPGASIADKFYRVAADDYSTTKKICEENNIDGIATSQMEKPLMLMAKLAEDKNYRFPTKDSIYNSLNKYQTKLKLLENDVPCAKNVLITRKMNVDDILLKDFTFPLIIKPVDSYSSKGVVKVSNKSEIDKYIDFASSFSSDRSVLIEEYLRGKEYSVETITFNGKTNVIQYTEKVLNEYFVEVGHFQPAELPEGIRRAIAEIVISAINAVGLDNTAAHTEVKLTENGPKIVEIGPRTGGSFISSYLCIGSCGVDMDKALLQVALGIPPNLKKKHDKYSYIKYLELPEGRKIKKIEDYSDINEMPGILFAYILLKPGDVIPLLDENTHRPAFVIVQGTSIKKVFALAKKAATFLKTKIFIE